MRFKNINHHIKPLIARRENDTKGSRRQFLKQLGLGAAFAPFVPLLDIEKAFANNAPKRLILCNYNHGMLHKHWKPSGSGRNFTLNNRMHRPFQPYKDKMIVFDNLKHLRPDGNNHFGGMTSMWTGAASKTFDGGNEHGLADGPSVDQFLVNRLTPETFYSSMQFGVAGREGQSGNGVNIYTGSLAPVTAGSDPRTLFDRIFMGTNGDSPELIELRTKRKSVLDLVYQDLQSLSPKVSANDQLKIEAHLDAVRSAEMRNEAAAAGSCELPGRPDSFDINANDNFPIITPIMLDLLAACLRCDLTRFCSLQFSVAINNIRFNWLTGANGKPINEGHHELSHSKEGTDGFKDYEAGTYWYMEQMASLLKRLDETTEEGGGTLLDNSLVVLATEISLGNNHGREPMPYVTFGGLGGKVDAGQFVDAKGQSHGRLLTSICHAFDQTDVQRFGSLDKGNGTLPILT